MAAYKDITVEIEGHVQIVTIRRPPFNYFDNALIRELAAAFEAADKNPEVRVSVLAAEGKSFCAGADLVNRSDTGTVAEGGKHLYKEAARLFRTEKPIIAAVHGAAIGGGLGLAVMADFRVTCAEARFSVNFNRLGFHPGFGLSFTLPRLVGAQQAALLFYTGRRIGGEEALRIGLADRLVEQAQVRAKAIELAAEIAVSSPIAVQSTRATLRAGFVEQFRLAVARESIEQNAHFKTADFAEGVKAMAERRVPRFEGH